MLGKSIYKIYRITYFLDVGSTVLIYSIVSWSIFEFLMWRLGIAKDSWISDDKKGTFYEYKFLVIVIRIVFFGIIFLTTIPLFLKKKMDDLQIVTALYLCTLFLLIFWILIELPFFYFNYKKNNIDTKTHYFKKFEPKWVKNFFGLMVSYYV